MKTIIFSDLDGTLLDKKYSFQKAKKALALIRKKRIPLVICTSKTSAEIKEFRKEIKNNHPFICEDGGAIFIPKKYFEFKFKYNRKQKGYFIIELGTNYLKLRKVLNKLQKKYNIVGFGDLTPEKLAKDSGLSIKKAGLALKREYDEPFKILNKKHQSKIIDEIKKNKLNYIKGGRYWHLTGKNDKGKAVSILIELFKKKFKDIETVAFGDAENDFPMLDAVDKGFLDQKPNRTYASKRYLKAKGVGPIGLNKEVINELKTNKKS